MPSLRDGQLRGQIIRCGRACAEPPRPSLLGCAVRNLNQVRSSCLTICKVLSYFDCLSTIIICYQNPDSANRSTGEQSPLSVACSAFLQLQSYPSLQVVQ